jgi:cytoskeletal protein CcmA (bactofilin family)
LGDEVVLGKNKVDSSEFNGYLGQGTSLTGDLSFSGKLHLNGDFRGTISTADVLIIGEKATVAANIKAGEVRIGGKVNGNIECIRRVEICEKGQLKGDVRAPQFIINEGGAFEGTSHTATVSEQCPDSRESLWEPDKPVDSIAQPSANSYS